MLEDYICYPLQYHQYTLCATRRLPKDSDTWDDLHNNTLHEVDEGINACYIRFVRRLEACKANCNGPSNAARARPFSHPCMSSYTRYSKGDITERLVARKLIH